MTNRSLFLMLILLVSSLAFGQRGIEINFKNTTYFSTGDSLPFWFWANHYGTVKQENPIFNLTQISVGNNTKATSKKLAFDWGTSAVGGLGKNNYLQLNEAFAGANWRGWKLEAGLFNDELLYKGLSTTNGNVARSINAAPYPKIRFSTIGYKPLPFIGKWAQFKAEYDEGILNDDRYVHNTRMHHKSLYGSLTPSESWRFNLGVEHYVMWGGVSKSPVYGKLPADFHSYLLYITGSTGNEEFPETDQLNVAGNQVGTYQAQIIKEFKELEVEAYVSHWFEDHSGLVFRNWKDNLLGVKIDFKKKDQFISTLVYEFMNTRNQSVIDSFYKWNEATQKWDAMENDTYFQHGVYLSGFTYKKMMMSSPLFIPQFQEDGLSMVIPSNRFYTHHIGVMGSLSRHLQWKGLCTYTHHFGTYRKPYEPVQQECSLFLDVNYSSPQLPVNIGISTAADFGNVRKTNLGVQLTVSKSW